MMNWWWKGVQCRREKGVTNVLVADERLSEILYILFPAILFIKNSVHEDVQKKRKFADYWTVAGMLRRLSNVWNLGDQNQPGNTLVLRTVTVLLPPLFPREIR